MVLIGLMVWLIVRRRRAAAASAAASSMPGAHAAAHHSQTGGAVRRSGGRCPSQGPSLSVPWACVVSAPATNVGPHCYAPFLRAGVSAHVSTTGGSLLPGLKERFELTEVVEQTGSPSSARRRARTPFHPTRQQQ